MLVDSRCRSTTNGRLSTEPRQASNDSKAVLSPIAGRTRSKQSLHEKFAGLGMTATPSKSTGHNRKIPDFGEDEEYDVAEQKDNVTLMYSMGSQRSPISPEAARILYPPAGDEEIVNVALIDFANALILHEATSNKWALNRILLTAEFKGASFHARTDGYLKNSQSSRIWVAVEVKPYVRNADTRIQETAEIVSLIMENAHPLLVVAQDRHEIFLTFALYDKEYLNYL